MSDDDEKTPEQIHAENEARGEFHGDPNEADVTPVPPGKEVEPETGPAQPPLEDSLELDEGDAHETGEPS